MIVLDVETTGLNPRRSCIISIGAVEFEHPENTFYGECRVGDDVVIEQAALRVNGFTRTQIIDPSKPDLVELTYLFDEWRQTVAEPTIGGHYVKFDMGMLQAAYRAALLPWPFGFNAVDMYTVVYAHMKRHNHPIPARYGAASISANRVYEYIGLPREPEPHNALIGAKMEAEAMSRLFFDQSLLGEFVDYPVKDFIR